VKTAAEIPLEKVRAATAEWPEHLKACIEAEGDIIINENLTTIANKLFGSKSECFV
jgi:hypothetical protein